MSTAIRKVVTVVEEPRTQRSRNTPPAEKLPKIVHF